MKLTVAWPRLLALTIFLGSMPVLNAAKDARTLFKASSPSVVLIKTYTSGHVPLKIGSGFFVATGKALVTNAHVIAGAAEIEVVRSDGVTVSVTEVLALAPAHDLAILSASGPPLQLSERKVEVGEAIFALGNPKGLSATFSDGMVSALRKLDDMSVIQITAPISPGSSGGPILDENGLVIGVASFGHRDGQNLNFAISSSNLVPMLAALKSMPLAIAAFKLEQAETQGALAHGADRLVVVKSSLNNRKNLSIAIKNTETYPVYKIFLRVLFYEDGREVRLAESKRESGSLKATLAVIERTTQLQQIMNGIKNLPAEEGEIRAKLAKIEAERQQLVGPTKPEELLLVDYADYILDGAIAPGLTKSFEVKGKEGIAKPLIVDYLIAGK